MVNHDSENRFSPEKWIGLSVFAGVAGAVAGPAAAEASLALGLMAEEVKDFGNQV